MRKFGYAAASLIPAIALVSWLWVSLPHDATPDAICPVPIDQLGLAVDHQQQAAVVAAALPAFQIVGADGQDNSRRNVRLWDDVVAVRGEHLPNVPQQIGDCVSFGTAHAVEYLQYSQMRRGPPGPPAQFRPVYPPFVYGASRIDIGRAHGSRFNGDGSVGAYAAEAVQQLGVLPADHPQCPPYSGDVARTWGRTGPPAWSKDVARDFKVGSIAQMRSADDVRDANCNGYTVIICSDFGTRTIREQYGRMVARFDARWQHCMAIIGYDGSGPEPLWYVLNSWGPDAHPRPLQGEPPGGFWIDRKTLEYIVRSGDCWALSAFDGFPAQDLDLSPLRPHKADAQPVRQQFIAERSHGGSRA